MRKTINGEVVNINPLNVEYNQYQKLGLLPTDRKPTDYMRMSARTFSTFRNTPSTDTVVSYINGFEVICNEVSIIEEIDYEVTLENYNIFKINKGACIIDNQLIDIFEDTIIYFKNDELMLDTEYCIVIEYDYVDQYESNPAIIKFHELNELTFPREDENVVNVNYEDVTINGDDTTVEFSGKPGLIIAKFKINNSGEVIHTYLDGNDEEIPGIDPQKLSNLYLQNYKLLFDNFGEQAKLIFSNMELTQATFIALNPDVISNELHSGDMCYFNPDTMKYERSIASRQKFSKVLGLYLHDIIEDTHYLYINGVVTLSAARFNLNQNHTLLNLQIGHHYYLEDDCALFDENHPTMTIDNYTLSDSSGRITPRFYPGSVRVGYATANNVLHLNIDHSLEIGTGNLLGLFGNFDEYSREYEANHVSIMRDSDIKYSTKKIEYLQSIIDQNLKYLGTNDHDEVYVWIDLLKEPDLIFTDMLLGFLRDWLANGLIAEEICSILPTIPDNLSDQFNDNEKLLINNGLIDYRYIYNIYNISLILQEVYIKYRQDLIDTNPDYTVTVKRNYEDLLQLKIKKARLMLGDSPDEIERFEDPLVDVKNNPGLEPDYSLDIEILEGEISSIDLSNKDIIDAYISVLSKASDLQSKIDELKILSDSLYDLIKLLLNQNIEYEIKIDTLKAEISNYQIEKDTADQMILNTPSLKLDIFLMDEHQRNVFNYTYITDRLRRLLYLDLQLKEEYKLSVTNFDAISISPDAAVIDKITAEQEMERIKFRLDSNKKLIMNYTEEYNELRKTVFGICPIELYDIDFDDGGFANQRIGTYRYGCDDNIECYNGLCNNLILPCVDGECGAGNINDLDKPVLILASDDISAVEASINNSFSFHGELNKVSDLTTTFHFGLNINNETDHVITPSDLREIKYSVGGTEIILNTLDTIEDFFENGITLMITNGELKSPPIIFTITDDSVWEASEYITGYIDNSSDNVVIHENIKVVTIVDNELPPVNEITIRNSDPVDIEADEEDTSNVANFRISRLSERDEIVTVNIDLLSSTGEDLISSNQAILEYYSSGQWIEIQDKKVTIPFAVQDVLIRVKAIQDDLVEGPMSFSVVISHATNDAHIVNNIVNGIIVETDTNPAHFSIRDTEIVNTIANEENPLSVGTYELVRVSGDPSRCTLNINLLPTDVEHTISEDDAKLQWKSPYGVWEDVSETITMDTGVNLIELRVQAIDDDLVEDNELYKIVISNPTLERAVIDNSTVFGTITSDDTYPQITLRVTEALDTSATEGEADYALYELVRTSGRNDDVTVNVNIVNDNNESLSDQAIIQYLSDGLWRNSTGTLTLGVDKNVLSIRVMAVDDNTIEDNMTFTLIISNPTNNAIINGNSVLGVLISDDTIPGISVTAITADAYEEDEQSAIFEIARNTGSGDSFGFDYIITGIGEHPVIDDDYRVYSNVDGSWEACDKTGSIVTSDTCQIKIVPVNDIVKEETEGFQITISNPVNCNIIEDKAFGSIIDNDEVKISIQTNIQNVAEGSSVEIYIVRDKLNSEASSADLHFTLNNLNVDDIGSITHGGTTITDTSEITDFINSSTTLAISSTETESNPVIINFADDIEVEDTESLICNIDNPVNGILDTTEVTINVVDNDVVIVNIMSDNDTAKEESDDLTISYYVTSSQAVSFDVAVDSHISGIQGDDLTKIIVNTIEYTEDLDTILNNIRCEVKANTTRSDDVILYIKNDYVEEGTETCHVIIDNPDNCQINNDTIDLIITEPEPLELGFLEVYNGKLNYTEGDTFNVYIELNDVSTRDESFTLDFINSSDVNNITSDDINLTITCGTSTTLTDTEIDDLISNGREIIIPEGETRVNLEFTLVDDLIVEGTEFANLKINDTSVDCTRDELTLIFDDNDSPTSELSITATDDIAFEDDDTNQQLIFKISATEEVANDVRFKLKIHESSTLTADDIGTIKYGDTSESIPVVYNTVNTIQRIFDEGISLKLIAGTRMFYDITFIVNNDEVAESDEKLVLVLDELSDNILPGNVMCEATIYDTDPSPLLSFSEEELNVNQGDTINFNIDITQVDSSVDDFDFDIKFESSDVTVNDIDGDITFGSNTLTAQEVFDGKTINMEAGNYDTTINVSFKLLDDISSNIDCVLNFMFQNPVSCHYKQDTLPINIQV